MSEALGFASLRELAVRLRRRDLSCEELVTALIERTRKAEPHLNSYITFLPEPALAQARAADDAIRRRATLGLLHGIPVSIKDHIATAGVRTSAGAKSMLDRIPTKDAGVARRLKEAGAILMGKANMNKFAGGDSGDNPDFGKIKTPWNLEFSAGGSSGGSAAMVAAGLVPLSVGTDSGGSIRIPAAVCGIVGLKPTYGRVSVDGISPRAYSFDHAGPLTRSVEDAAIALQVLAGHDAGNETTSRRPVPDYAAALARPATPLRIGIDSASAEFAQPAVRSRFEAALKVFEGAGASIREVSTPTWAEWLAVGNSLMPEFGVAFAEVSRQHPEDVLPEDVPFVVASELVPAVDYIRASQQRRVLQKRFAVATRDVDLFACPSYTFEHRPFGARPAIDGRATTGDDAVRFTLPFDLLGLPAISLPCGFSDGGFPIGLQLVGRAFDEVGVLRAAHLYEQATEWHSRRPPSLPD